MQSDEKEYETAFKKYVEAERIIPSNSEFKIKLFLEKSDNSLQIAKHHKDIIPTKDQPPKLPGTIGPSQSRIMQCSTLPKQQSSAKDMK